jgi:hypothetical protein
MESSTVLGEVGSLGEKTVRTGKMAIWFDVKIPPGKQRKARLLPGSAYLTGSL